METPSLNQGLGFTLSQRETLGINGLLPFGERSIELQSKLIMNQINNKISNDLDKYRYLMNIMEINEKLFYYTLINNLYELMPIVYTPIVGNACLELGYILNKFNHGIWINIENDIGNIENILSQWPNKDEIKGIVVTDGERILGLGDLGAFGMGIPIGKIALYTAIGGIKPNQLLPISIDVGTWNDKLLNDPFYFGIKKKRSQFKDKYDIFIDEFMESIVNVFGKTTLIQFEDFGNSNAFRLLNKYQNKYTMFNDDIQGTAAITLAGIYSSLKGKYGINKLINHKFLMIGAGSAGIGIADIITTAIIKESNYKISIDKAREYIWLIDSKGLIFNNRKSGGISKLKKPYSKELIFNHDNSDIKDIKYIINKLGITAIIGVSGQPKQFTKNIIITLQKNNQYPLIMSLSNPTSKSECTAQEAYDYTNNKLYFASGSPFKLRNNTFPNYKNIIPSQGNNAYIFPGIALGIIASQANQVPNDIFLIAAQTVSNLVNKDMLNYGVIYPPIEMIRDVSIAIAVQVAKEIHDKQLTKQKRPQDFEKLIKDIQYNHQIYDTFDI